MRTILLLAALFTSLTPAHGQSSKFNEMKARLEAQEQARTRGADSLNYRTVNGQLYHIQRSTNWTTLRGHILGQTNGVTLLRLGTLNPELGTQIALTNLPAGRPNGTISLRAMRVGHWDNAGQSLELWDCGTDAAPPASALLPPRTPETPGSALIASLEARRAALEKKVKTLESNHLEDMRMFRLRRDAGQISPAAEVHQKNDIYNAHVARVAPLNQQIRALALQIAEYKKLYKMKN